MKNDDKVKVVKCLQLLSQTHLIFLILKKKSHINKIKTNNPMWENGRRNKILLVKITYKWYLNIGKDT